MNQDLIEKIKKFRAERNRDQFHNPKDLPISISLEAADRLEIFQWSGVDLEKSYNLENLKEELADVMIYCILLSESWI